MAFMRGTTSSVIYRGSRASQHAKIEFKQTTSSDEPTKGEQQEFASEASMAQVHSGDTMIHGPSKVAIGLIPPNQSRVSIAPSRSSVSHLPRASSLRGRCSKGRQSVDFGAILSQMSAFDGQPRQDVSDFNALTKYFLGFWKAPHVAAALTHLEKSETKRAVRALQKRHGFWQPPPEVAEALKKTLPTATSNLPDNKYGRNLKFVLKVLGCSLHENKPYKQFLRAKSLRQKRKWLYKYQGPPPTARPSPTYMEPVCPTRLKRLYQFVPERFTDEDGYMYFNNKMLTYDETKRVFYIGKELLNE